MKSTKLLLIGILLSLWVTQSAWAQSEDNCTPLEEDEVSAIKSACSALADGQACDVAGSITSLNELPTLETTTADAQNLILLNVTTSETPIQMMLFGESALHNAVEALPDDLAELIARNAVGYNVNLRGGAGTQYPVVGAFEWNAENILDGRNADGTWVRVQHDAGDAWVSADLVNIEGDIESLAVLDKPYIYPMQAAELSTEACGGLLIKYSGETNEKLQINDIDLTIQTGTFLLQTTAESVLEAHVIDGHLDAQIEGETVAAQAGQTLQIKSENETLTAEVIPAYPFSLAENAPARLVLENAEVCIAGIRIDNATTSYQKPSLDAEVAAEVDPHSHYQITGWAEDDNGNRWWKIQGGQVVGWVPEKEIRTAGLCSNVAQIDPNAASAPAASSSSGGAASSSLPPEISQDRTIWWANSGQEFQTGICNYPPLTLCEHMVAITPTANGTISWRGQEPDPYTLTSQGDGVFSYAGRNKLGDANITMALTFQSSVSWTMTMTQVFDNDPECIRTFYYTARPR